ncbi:MAG: glycine--tRNA ligase subunit beta [Actinomycetota bacterium]|nr:glycine--tRNA ligase subunit beta [Actinomycetota bacterium]
MAEELLFEIGTEELPWGAVQEGRRQLRENAASLLRRERLDYRSIDVYSTPRRLALLVEGLEDIQEDSESLVRGPSRQVAFDEEGNPTRAAEGFARSKGVSVDGLEVRETEKGEFVFAVVREKGRHTTDVLPAVLDELMRSFNFRKSMCWGDGDFRFARPVRWITALFGGEVVPLRFEGLAASRLTRGHRFLSPGEVAVGSPHDYLGALREARVLADEEERRRAVQEGMEAALSQKELRAVVVRDTLDEVVDLVEYPHVVLGHFEERFLELPREVLETAMREHQRYFPTEKGGNELAAAFLLVHNGDPGQDEMIRRGNERVLRARLEDAVFFYREDLALPLERRLDELKSVVWQARLGSMYDKSLRLRELCAEICHRARIDAEVIERASRAALLCKTDLVTAMVVEFPSLQGIMGRIYALAEGEDEEAARAIEEHYLPRFSGDALPLTRAGGVLSLGEKIDNLVGCFGAGMIPSGSEDPYALRRQSQAILSILVDAGMHLDLGFLLEEAARRLEFVDPESVASQVGEFCLQRWRQMLVSEGSSYDLVAAVLPLALLDPLDARRRLETMEKARSRGLLQKVYTGFERCYNLSRKSETKRMWEELLVEEAEKNLYSKLVWSQGPLRDYLDENEHEAALELLMDIAPTVDRFFEDIFVMGDDDSLRENRLALLGEVAELFMRFADFTQVVTEGEGT